MYVIPPNPNPNRIFRTAQPTGKHSFL